MRALTLVGVWWLVMATCGVAGSGARDRKPAPGDAAGQALCEVHGLAMKRVEVPLTLGLPAARFRADPRIPQAEHFPNAVLRVFGGCCINGDEPKTVSMFHCAACLRAAFAWEAAHRIKDGRPPPVAPRAHRAMGRRAAERMAVVKRQ